MADDEDAKLRLLAVRLPLVILVSLVLLFAIGVFIYKVA